MPSGAPWSVKGIDPRARAIAKTAARKEGLTLGEWLNKVILEDGDFPAGSGWDSRLEAYPGFGSGGGGGGGDEDEDDALRQVVERLTDRLEAAERRSTLAMTGVDQSVLALARRLEALEEAREEGEEEAAEGVRRLKSQTDELLDRIRRLERAPPGAGASPEALKAVETTVGKIAARLYETEREVRAELDSVALKEDRRRDTAERMVKSLAQRVEDAEKRFREEAAALREAGQARDARGADAAASLEDIARTLKSRILAAETETHRAADALARHQEALDTRLRSLEARAGASVGSDELDSRFDALARELADIVRETRADCARQIAALQAAPGDSARLEKALEAAEARLGRAEERQTAALSRIAEEVGRLSCAVDARILDAERRIEQKFHDSESRRDRRDDRSDIETRLERVRAENTAAVRKIGEQVARLGESLAERVQQAEIRSARAVEAAGERMAEVVQKLETRRGGSDSDLDARIRASEERTAQRIEQAMVGVHERLDQARKDTSDALSPVQRAMTALADRLEQIEQRRSRASAALESSGPATASVTDSPSPRAAEPAAPDLSAPLPPPPGSAGPDLGLEDPARHRDPFVIEAEAPRPARAAAAESDWTYETRARPLETANRAAAAPQAEPAEPAAAAAAPQAEAPRRPARPGATADPDFLAAARKTVRANRTESDWRDTGAPRRPSPLLVGASVLGFVAVSAAAAMMALEAFGGGGAPVRPADSAAAVRDAFAAPTADAASATLDPVAPEIASIRETPPASEGAEPNSAESAPVAADPEPVAAAVDAPVVPARISVTVPTLETAAAAGDSVARYQLALDRLEAGQAADAAALMRRAAEQGEPDAMRRFAQMLQSGQGVQPDSEAARIWMTRAAEAGNIQAMHDAGGMYVSVGDAPDAQAAAARFFEQGALHGVRDSQFNMGLLYQEGFGVPQSLADAYAWFQIAAAAGDADAARRAAELRRDLDPEARTAADAVAARFTPRSSDPRAQGVYPPQLSETADPRAVTARAQALLAELGYDPGPADGSMGEQTRQAIVRYQTEAGLEPGGPVDAALIARLERAAAD